MDELISKNPAAIKKLMDAIEDDANVGTDVFARLVGKSERITYAAWKDGRLPCKEGKLPVREGIVAFVSCGGLRKDGKSIPKFILDADARARELLGLSPRDGQDETESEGGDTAEWKLKYLKAQTAAREAAAHATQMRNEVERGKLIYRAEVELDAAETATNIASALSRLPERAAGMCVGCSADEIASILRKEITDIIGIIRDSSFAGIDEGVS